MTTRDLAVARIRKDWNENPRPFIWTKTAEEILAKLARLLTRINGGGH